jgi:cellulose biosynthesis protein BcsQ
MHLTVFSEKGGVGKTSAAILLSVLLEAELIDLDPQKTATRWLARRADLRQVQPDYWVTDCAPGTSMDSAQAVKDADLVVVPVMVSFPCFDSLPQTVKFIKTHSSPSSRLCFIGMDIDVRTNDAGTLRAALKGYGAPIAGLLSHRASYRRAGLTGGLAGDTDTVAAAEATALIKSILEILK